MGSSSSSFSIHPSILYAIILLLVGYVATDLLRGRFDARGVAEEEAAERGLWMGRGIGGGGGGGGEGTSMAMAELEPEICKSVEGHMEEEEETAEDPWRQMKWVGKAARCRVKGQFIEKLDAQYNFRRGFALRFTDDVEDKTHLLPWMLGARVDLRKGGGAGRRILLDLGAAAFSSSVAWFLSHYPCDFTEVHAFDPDPNLLRLPEPTAASANESQNYAPPNELAHALKSVAPIPAWMLRRIRLYHRFVSDIDDDGSRAINITRFIKEELRPVAGVDTLVVKMDIEGSEWDVLRRWMSDPTMSHVVDELFVEVHYDHPSMRAYHWARFAPTSRSDAFRLLAQLRHAGFYAHPWP